MDIDDALKPDGAFGQKTLTAIMTFQRIVFGKQTPNGRGLNREDRS